MATSGCFNADAITDAETVANILRNNFSPDDFDVSAEQGLVYLIPKYTRLHLDIYMVHRDEVPHQVTCVAIN